MTATDADGGTRRHPHVRRLRRAGGRFTEHALGVVGLAILAVAALLALFPGVFAPHSPDWVAYVGTSGAHLTTAQARSLPGPPAFGDPYFAPLGTTAEGHGVLTTLVYGARTALFIGLAAGVLSSLVGVPLGLVSGFYGDTWIDEAIQRFVDVMYGLPFLPFLVVLVAIRGVTPTNVVIGIAVTSWLNNCVVIRGETLSLRERAYVEAARASGQSDLRILARHVLPSVLPLSFVFLAQDAAAAVLAQASLAYLGLSDFTTHSWGLMLQSVRASGHVFDAPWWLLPPGVALTLLIAAFYFVGFSMEDVTNPHR